MHKEQLGNRHKGAGTQTSPSFCQPQYLTGDMFTPIEIICKKLNYFQLSHIDGHKNIISTVTVCSCPPKLKTTSLLIAIFKCAFKSVVFYHYLYSIYILIFGLSYITF